MIDTLEPGANVSAFPAIREVDSHAPLRWLSAGWHDFRQAGWNSLFYGGGYVLGGWLLALAFMRAYALFAGMVMGFLLVAPVLATNLYGISRRIERGEPIHLSATMMAWRANIPNIALLAAVLGVVFLLWARASMVVFVMCFDTSGLPSFIDIVRAIVTLRQPEFALAYFAVGGFFATFSFAVSVISVPLMLDRGTDAVTAALASLLVCARNPGPMLLWAACIACLVLVGFATGFLGLIVAMPLAGHATWHAYRELLGPGGATERV